MALRMCAAGRNIYKKNCDDVYDSGGSTISLTQRLKQRQEGSHILEPATLTGPAYVAHAIPDYCRVHYARHFEARTTDPYAQSTLLGHYSPGRLPEASVQALEARAYIHASGYSHSKDALDSLLFSHVSVLRIHISCDRSCGNAKAFQEINRTTIGSSR
jgi:hypothetical protein